MRVVCMQDVVQAENASQKYIQQMFRQQQPQAPAAKSSPQPQGMCCVCLFVDLLTAPVVLSCYAPLMA